MVAEPPPAGGRKITEMNVAPLGGEATLLETEILPPGEDPELPEGTETVSDPMVAVAVNRSSPSAQIYTVALETSLMATDMEALPKGRRFARKCS
jgi:hypothetical protein